MQKIIILSWAPWTGKSTLAKKIAKDFFCPFISGDFIRNWLQVLFKEDRKNNLFLLKWSAKEHYSKYSIEDTLEMEYKRDKEVFKWIKPFIEHNKDWDFYIMEWISFHPEFIWELDFNNIEIFPIFLVDQNYDRIKSILKTRWLWGIEHETKKIEAEYLKLANNNYLNEAKKYDLKYFILDMNRKKSIEEIKKYIRLIVQKK